MVLEEVVELEVLVEWLVNKDNHLEVLKEEPDQQVHQVEHLVVGTEEMPEQEVQEELEVHIV